MLSARYRIRVLTTYTLRRIYYSMWISKCGVHVDWVGYEGSGGVGEEDARPSYERWVSIERPSIVLLLILAVAVESRSMREEDLRVRPSDHPRISDELLGA